MNPSATIMTLLHALCKIYLFVLNITTVLCNIVLYYLYTGSRYESLSEDHDPVGRAVQDLPVRAERAAIF